tara:strand:- start:196 stop:525 length:330 start_codon:yes stop_codon:yes gene_type:complete
MNKINWVKLNDTEILIDNTNYVVIFKHSPRCIISRIVLDRFEKDYKKTVTNLEFAIVDVISQKKMSGHISDIFKIRHESPQLILIKNNNVLLSLSHENILFSSLQKMLT